MIELLIAGGTGTTASLIGQTLVWLDEHHDERRQLIDHPDMLPRAVEEFLRCFSPTQALARTVTTDVEFHSCPMRQGDRVLLCWASANADFRTGTSALESGGTGPMFHRAGSNRPGVPPGRLAGWFRRRW